MHLNWLAQLSAALLLAPSVSYAYEAADDLENWISSWNATSFTKLLDNIGPNGAKARDVPAGVIIASPSKSAPDYFYQWTRDSALSIREVIDAFGNGAVELLPTLTAWVDQQIKVAHVNNPSGGFATGGLGEPKFMVDGSAYWGAWGRPQRDGPPLRASAVMRFIAAWNKTDPNGLRDSGFVRKLYDGAFPTNSLLKADLEYTANLWSQEGFDPWEEERGYNLYPVVSSVKALEDGAAFARLMGDSGAADWYAQQATAASQNARKFWDSNRNILIKRLNSGRNGLDCDTLLGANHNMNPDLYPPWSDEILATLEAFTRQMANLYPIAKVHQPPNSNGKLYGVPIGRYSEDVYDGVGTSIGHPWFLCTAGSAETLYKAITGLKSSNRITITNINKRFYDAVGQSNFPVGTSISTLDTRHASIIDGMFKLADEFLAVIKYHAGGSMSEQFDRNTGHMRGASDLTWSYASFVTAVDARAKAKALVNGASSAETRGWLI